MFILPVIVCKCSFRLITSIIQLSKYILSYTIWETTFQKHIKQQLKLYIYVLINTFFTKIKSENKRITTWRVGIIFLKIKHALILFVNAVLILYHRHTFDEILKLFYNHTMKNTQNYKDNQNTCKITNLNNYWSWKCNSSRLDSF